MSPDKAKQIRSSFSAQSLMATLGAEIALLERGTVEIRAPILPGSRQQHGIAHAGLTFSIGDSAAGYAALSTMPDGYEVLTTEMKINLLAPAKGDYLIARGRVIKPGRRLVIVQADVFAVETDEETHVALLTGTMMPMAPA
ncbi:PaaI family thioesterase [Roseovarius sp. CAU 1744]|uniref:PaaI family thioesterase n=1 Tax=Roseovarius sp. CAU 1744 TaxID=3140368 RepID=UPI00325C0C7B